MAEEETICGSIVATFDLGFILEFLDGRRGELRTPEMSQATADWERQATGLGNEVEVYVVSNLAPHGGYLLLSEYSANERCERQRQWDAAIEARERTAIGSKLTVRIERKLTWGCLCRQTTEPFLEGVLSAPTEAERHGVPEASRIISRDWEPLQEGNTIAVLVCHRRNLQSGVSLHFELASPNGS
ncbi:MAG: hypothetical protein AAFX06_28565 [Planctomycetota bacterium]